MIPSPSSSSSAELDFSMVSSYSSSKWLWVPRTRASWVRVLGLDAYGRMLGLCGEDGRIINTIRLLLFLSFLGCYLFGRNNTLWMISLTLYAVWFTFNCIVFTFKDFESCKKLNDEKRVEESFFMDNEENKQDDDTKSIPYVQLDRVDSDYAFALALQEQETPLTAFTMSESDSSEDDDGGSNEDGDDDYNPNHDEDGDEILEDELDDVDLDEEDSDNDEDIEDDDIDPDDLSYEDLIALGERVGSENNGLSMKEIASYLNPYPYQSQMECKYGVDQCVICQTEYEEEELMETLPCDHTFHFRCISKWLLMKKVCPICNSEVNSEALLKKHGPSYTPPPPPY